jgi:RNA polymerase sigma-70 factor (ECF subfamily)
VVEQEPGLRNEGRPAPEILVRIRRRLVSFAASRVQRDVAEDLTQDTLLLLTTKYREVTDLEDLLPLSIKVMRFKILSYHRKAHRRGEDTSVAIEDVDVRDQSTSPHTLAEQRQAVEQLKAALRQLSERCRKLFRLKLEGRGFAEIGNLLGAGSLNTVYSWEFRCRERLRRLLGGTWVRGGAP